jgi:hypothetical protein
MEKTEYAIKQVGDCYYPFIIDREAGGHYEIKNPLSGGILSYNNPEVAETYIKRAREKQQGEAYSHRCILPAFLRVLGKVHHGPQEISDPQPSIISLYCPFEVPSVRECQKCQKPPKHPSGTFGTSSP